MRYMKARQGGGAVKTYIGKREGVAEKPIFAYQGGGGVEKPENPAYIVYGWSHRIKKMSPFCKCSA